MPDYLTLSGIPLPVSADRPMRLSPTLLGEKRRSFSGWPLSSVRRVVMQYEAGTPIRAMAEATALRALVNGDGHSWSFETDTLSSRGLWPSSVTGAPGHAAGVGLFGPGLGALGLVAGDAITWPTQLGAAWTVGYWARVDVTGAPWKHYVQRSDVPLYVDASVATPAQGNSWTFQTSLSSTQGLAPAGTTGTVTAGVDGPGRFGRCASISAGGTLRYATGLGTQWTVAYWAKLTTASSWTHYIHRPGVNISRNGVVGNSPPSAGALYSSTGDWTNLPGGPATLLCPTAAGVGGFPNPGNVPLLVDDLVVLPYVAPDSWVAPWYAAGAPWGTYSLPGLTALAAVDSAGSLTMSHVGGAAAGFDNPTNAGIYVDDVVALPYSAPTAWLAPWRAAGAAFGPLPYQRAAGTSLPAPGLVLGDAGAGQVQEWLEGGQLVTGQSFDFTLQAVP
ncbi:hypothetical protein [Myxococcus virescens]|uniref:Uncharacterized protein n=1 Tax=Myxococcus virescens TaxID=83456 RepID=A0A511HNP0_9BACT|nr:hypothetical protein [Myxococcus virescens]GEL75213.1 hypothetical protein MVI01_69970 [Myxococcus virescens]SDD65380.1 hypothetical protein SAMN04488504_102138 [Myxococcus virescens]